MTLVKLEVEIDQSPEFELAEGAVNLVGANFSGRSTALATYLRARPPQARCILLGPYAESGLSGVATTVQEELHFYGGPRPTPAQGLETVATDLQEIGAQRVSTLSGGQQVLLALECFAQSSCSHLGVDGALEQLDAARRVYVISWLETLRTHARQAVVVDNRSPTQLRGRTWALPATQGPFALRLDHMPHAAARSAAPVVQLQGVSFAYPGGATVLKDVSLNLAPGFAYRLHGANGCGKSTLLKLLTGVVAPSAGELRLDGVAYRPHRSGNAAIALATQDPDHQWVATTFEADFARKQHGFRGEKHAHSTGSTSFADICEALGMSQSAQTHLLDLPKALRKRASWAWPLCGTLPWIALDEPSLGQDLAAVDQLAAAMQALIRRGHGIVFVSHDERLAQRVAHRTLSFGGNSVQLEDGHGGMKP